MAACSKGSATSESCPPRADHLSASPTIPPSTFSPPGRRTARASCSCRAGTGAPSLGESGSGWEPRCRARPVDLRWLDRPLGRWSPDGSSVAFLRDIGPDTDVWVLPAGGGEPLVRSRMEPGPASCVGRPGDAARERHLGLTHRQPAPALRSTARSCRLSARGTWGSTGRRVRGRFRHIRQRPLSGLREARHSQ